MDDASGLLSFPYVIERGERLWPDPHPLRAGFTKHVLETREALLLNENLAAERERFGSVLVAGESPKSVLFVPLVTGGRATGAIALDNFDREHAFADADVRLLTTLAGSLSVALENARLVHETRQRNAELALINSVQDALAGELELQAIYDAVGDRLQRGLRCAGRRHRRSTTRQAGPRSTSPTPSSGESGCARGADSRSPASAST